MGESITVAATAVLLRDAPSGFEVLMLERPAAASAFAGAWVFPGGGVEPGDAALDRAEASAARQAAVRETYEETGLRVAPESLVHLSTWVPPREVPRRFRTWFYAGRAPAGPLTLAPAECVDARWLRPGEALELHREARLRLLPPTWVTLYELSRHRTIDGLLQDAEGRPAAVFHTRVGAGGKVVMWPGDGAYEDVGRLDDEGPRHRLDMRSHPWALQRDETFAVD